MNQRIRELAEQANLTIATSSLWEHKVQEFAELIVKECVRYFNEDYERNFETLWREDLSKGMKEHFGVEE
jgi:hypothetical protein